MTHQLPLWDLSLRVGLSVLLGLLVGAEREFTVKSAGLRTHALLSLGACLFTVAGVEVAGVDNTRIAAQVVSGVGFLCGGAILREGATVRGLTTAASLWIAAALGLASGLGSWEAAAVSAVATVVLLIGLRQVEREFLPRKRRQVVTIDIAPDKDVEQIVPQLELALGRADLLTLVASRSRGTRVQLQTNLPIPSKLPALADRLLDLDGVEGVDLHH